MGKPLFSFLLCAALGLLCTPAVAADGTVRGRVVDPDGLALPGVVITVLVPGAQARTAVTDEDGAYAIACPPGHVAVQAQIEGFEIAGQDVVVTEGAISVGDFTLHLASHQEQITVKPEAATDVVGPPQPDAPATVTRNVVEAGMLPNSQYDDVLALLPNVVRAPDGSISVGGARAPQGALFVNGFNLTDPVSGGPALLVPLEAVDSVDVFTGGYSAELGRATAGVTSVHTRAGGDQFHSSANSFFPRLHWVDGQVRGLQYWEPNVGVSGPVIRGRVHFEEGLSYRFDRNPFGTVVGDQDQKFSSIVSWSQVDVDVSPAQHVVAAFAANPQHTDYANITAFTPAGTVPALDRQAFDASLEDRLTVGESGTLELRASYIRTDATLTPNGSGPYEMGHDVTQGSYFDRQDLRGNRAEASAVWSWTAGHGQLLKAGASLGRADLAGADFASPVTMLRSDGSIVRSITFEDAQPLSAFAYQTGLFLQDTWTVSPSLTVDVGARYDRTTSIGGTFSPRLAATAKLPGGKTTVTGSVGLFGDKLALEAYAFPLLGARVIQEYGPDGTPVGAARLYVNRIAGPLKAPVAARWNLELDRRLSSSWRLRVKYDERHGSDEPVVEPVALSQTTGNLLLESTGISRSRSLETTFAYRPSEGREVYLSYVHSQAIGNLNSLDVVEGLFRQAFVQPDAIAPLAADVPDRFLAWSVMHFPRRITVAPFVEARSGFPYSAIDESWLYAALPNSWRFPWFGSLDLYVNKVVGLPRHLPDARIGFKVYSLASVHSERDIQRDILRTDFGTTYNAVPRFYSFVFELLWGHK